MNILTYSDADVAEIKELTHEHLEEIADHLEMLARRAIREDRRKRRFMTFRRWLLAPVLTYLEFKLMPTIAALHDVLDELTSAVEEEATVIETVATEFAALVEKLHTQDGVPQEILDEANAIHEKLVASTAKLTSIHE